MLEATAQELHGAAAKDSHTTAEDYRQAETLLLKRAQLDSFPVEFHLLKAGKPVHRSSRLLTLSPEMDDTGELIRVDGRLHRSEDLAYSSLHPLVLDPSHPVTRLLIQNFDSRLCHPGLERVVAGACIGSCEAEKQFVASREPILNVADGERSLLYPKWQICL